MLALNETTKTFEIILGAVPATEGEWTTSYLEGAMDSGVPSTFDAKIDSGVSNGTTAVTVLSAPPANARRVLKSFCYYSVVASTFTFRLNDGTATRKRVVFVLDAGDIVTYEDSEGWNVLDSTGGQKTDTGVSFPLLAPDSILAYSFINAPSSGISYDPTGGGGVGATGISGPDAAAGSNIAGKTIVLLSGRGRGSGASGNIEGYLAPAGASGSGLNPYAQGFAFTESRWYAGIWASLTPSATPSGIQGVDASGTNVVGNSLRLISGRSTGNATPTKIDFQTPGVGASGSTLQTLVTRMGINGPSLELERTNTAAGTTGAQTIDKMAGSVNFAAGATTLVVTNSLVAATSNIICMVQTNDATAVLKNCVPAAGSFTITLTAPATAETRVAFWVLN